LNTSASVRSSLRAMKKMSVREGVRVLSNFLENIVIVIFPNLQNRSEVPLHIVLPSTPTRESYTLLTAAKLLKNY